MRAFARVCLGFLFHCSSFFVGCKTPTLPHPPSRAHTPIFDLQFCSPGPIEALARPVGSGGFGRHDHVDEQRFFERGEIATQQVAGPLHHLRVVQRGRAVPIFAKRRFPKENLHVNDKQKQQQEQQYRIPQVGRRHFCLEN